MDAADRIQQYRALKAEVQVLLNDVGASLVDLLDNAADEEAHRNIDQSIHGYFQSYYDLRTRHDQDGLQVAVLALTKSGKSTLINALLGDELMPVLDISAPLVVLDTNTTDLSGPAGTAVGADGSHVNLCLLDTPGPNEAGEEGLKYQVERLLERVDAVIYLLDYTKLKTAEEAQVLGRLKTINPALVGRLSSRLFFAVNKMDQADEGCGLDDDQTREYVAEMITCQLNCPDFKLHPDQVLLLSARNALLARLVLAGRADAGNTQRFCRIAFGNFSTLRSSSAGSTSATGGRSPALVAAAASDMLDSSGVPDLEERVLGFLFEAAAGVKLVATLDDLGRLLTEESSSGSSTRRLARTGRTADVLLLTAMDANLGTSARIWKAMHLVMSLLSPFPF
eukprot:gene5529-5763_t